LRLFPSIRLGDRMFKFSEVMKLPAMVWAGALRPTRSERYADRGPGSGSALLAGNDLYHLGCRLFSRFRYLDPVTYQVRKPSPVPRPTDYLHRHGFVASDAWPYADRLLKSLIDLVAGTKDAKQSDVLTSWG